MKDDGRDRNHDPTVTRPIAKRKLQHDEKEDDRTEYELHAVGEEVRGIHDPLRLRAVQVGLAPQPLKLGQQKCVGEEPDEQSRDDCCGSFEICSQCSFGTRNWGR